MVLNLVATYASDGHELKDPYHAFWQEFLKIGPGKITPNSLGGRPVQHTPGKTLRIDFACSGEPMAILGASNRGAPGVSQFDIYFSGSQTVGRVEEPNGELRWVIVASEFKVLYLNALETAEIGRHWRGNIAGKSIAYSGYQFVANLTEPVTRHLPDCHARYCIDSVDEHSIKRRYKESHVGWEARARHGQPQIPSAPIDLAGLLYMILHGHLGAAVETGWPRNIRSAVAKLPTYPLEVDGRSGYQSWYEHSHSSPAVLVPPPLTMVPVGWQVPEPAKSAGWGAKIANRERLEVPHITVYRHNARDWRINLRTGEFLSGNRHDVPEELLAAIGHWKQAWRDLWDANYQDNPVGVSTW